MKRLKVQSADYPHSYGSKKSNSIIIRRMKQQTIVTVAQDALVTLNTYYRIPPHSLMYSGSHNVTLKFFKEETSQV